MNLDVKELIKALDFFKKNGNPVSVKVDFDIKGHFRMSAYTDVSGQVVVTLFDAETAKMPEVTKTERL